MKLGFDMLTYKVKLQFDTEDNKQYWIDLLSSIVSCYDYISNLIWNNKQVPLTLKSIHDLVYDEARKQFPNIPSQAVIKVYKNLISNYRTNKRKYKCSKHTKSLVLDKRLYSSLDTKSIKIVSCKAHKRCTCSFVLYDKFNSLASNYVMLDPTITYNDDTFYLSIPFDVPNKPVLEESYLGIDLGIKRFYTTSDGDSIKTKDLNKLKRKIRYQKRCLQSHKKSHSARYKLHKTRRKEHNINKEYCYLMSKQILKTDKSIIVMEDLSSIKQTTSRHKNGYKRTKHNNMISQVPFYLFKQILSYKALLLGKKVETVSPSYTSQINCITGKIDGTRKGCRYYCADGIVLDADWNASINIACRKHSISFNIPLDGQLNFLDRV